MEYKIDDSVVLILVRHIG